MKQRLKVQAANSQELFGEAVCEECAVSVSDRYYRELKMKAMPIPRIVRVTNVEGSGEKNLYQTCRVCNGKLEIS